MDLHAQIMNIPQTQGLAMANATEGQQLAYKLGHRDARHAAAELAAAYEAEIEALRKAAKRYHWMRDNPLWSVGYREKRGKREWRMRQEGEYWGEWWPTHEQAVDHAMALDKAVAAARAARAAVGAA